MMKLFSKIELFVKKRYRLIFILLLLSILIRPIQLVFESRDYLFTPGYEKQYETYKKAYYSSQYVQKKNPIIIPDQTFRSFAGGAFLKGLNPIMITHDHPPLGNYIIALSILIFDNPRTIMVPILAFAILGVFLVSRQAIGNSLISLIPLGIFINRPLFLNKFKYLPLVEPIQFPFILFAFYFFIKALKEKRYIKWLALTSLLLGGVISTRFFITGAVIAFCMVLYLLIEKRGISKKLIYFVLTLPISLVVLVASYTKTIMDGYSIVQILGVQKYILAYHKSKFIFPFSFWDLLLFNKWHTWWGDNEISSDPQWVILWPISVFLTALHAIYALFKKFSLNQAEKFILLWLILYTLTLSTGYSSTNYFLTIIPFFYILSVSFLQKTYISYFKKNDKKT
jgi:4-amino-4-deoxy-L-arabinose transferase-like glycosyltransferase